MLIENLLLVNKQNKINQTLLEKEMLDISIENADKLKNKDAFLKDTYRVEEKFDGSKLTLWRNDNDWNEDYEQNIKTYCSNNNLTSLKGLPKIIKGEL